MRRLPGLAAGLAAALGAVALAPAQAGAAACPGDLTVAGVKVTPTPNSCEASGSDLILENPSFGTTGTVRVTGLLGIGGKMRATGGSGNAKAELASDPPTAPRQLSVNGRNVFLGPMKFGNFELCDPEPASTEPPPGLGDAPGGENPDISGGDSRAKDESGATTGTLHVPRGVGCRVLPAFKLDFVTFDKLGDLAGLPIGQFTAKLPTVAGFDDQNGGRVFMAAPFKLPKIFDTEIQEGGQKKKVPTFVALGIQFSASEGLRPFSGGFRLDRPIPLGVPGLALERLNGLADTLNDRFGGGLQLRLPGGKALGANLTLQSGDIAALGGDVALPVPFPLFGGAISVTTIGGSFQGTTSSTGPGGATAKTPASIQGRAKFTVGPAAGGGNPFQGDMSITLAGPSVELAGNLFAVVADKQIKLGDARVLISVKPARFEAEANATLFDIIQAHIFVGIVPEHFTALGEASVTVPKDIKIIGGKKLGGFSMALSDVGVGAVITVDPPFVKPIRIGVGSTFKPLKFKLIDSVSQFVTVKPSSRSLRAAASRNLRIPSGKGDVIVSVEAKGRVPRNVKLSMRSRNLKFTKLGSGSNSVQYGLANPPAGQLTVSSSDALTKIEAGRVREFPYLDPSPGVGTQPQGPILAGQSARVCWKVKNAPKGALIDLFEDQNGNLGTGRNVATGLKPSDCFDVPTAGLEPGRHWVYGVVRVGEQPINQRYWPVPITVVDPNAPPAPEGVSVTPTEDGASVGWNPVAGAGSYIVRAEPVDDEEGEAVELDVPATSLATELSLRGAEQWNVTVQAVLSGGGRGNQSVAQTVTPPDPVVLGGKPSGAAQVGKLWAFQLKVFGGVNLRLVKGPAGMKLASGGVAQLRWTPSKRAGSSAPQEFVVEGCKGDRCVTRTFYVSAYGKGFAPFGPARGFQVTPNVVKSGALVTIHAQGVDAKPVVKIDGKTVKGVRVVDTGAIEFQAPKLAKGAHDITLKIGKDAEERKAGALVVV